MQQLAQQLNQTADEMQKAQANGRNNQSESIAQNERALERLQQAQQRLQQMNSATPQRGGQSGAAGRQQQIADLRQRAAQAASRQREIAKDVENLARRGGQNAQDENSKKTREQLAERKDTLADSVNSLQQDLEQSAQAMSGGSQGQQRAARQLKEAADSLARDRVADRIREGKQSLNAGRQNDARQDDSQQNGGRGDERAIERSLNNLSEKLQAAEQSARGPNGSTAEENLDRTRQLADNLDSLRRAMEERAARPKGQQQGPSGQQSSQSGQHEGQTGSSQEGRQSQGARDRGGMDRSGAIGGDWGDNRQLPAEIRERLREAQDLRRDWGATGMSAGRLDEAIEELKRLADSKMEGDAATAGLLKAEVVDPLRQLELELSRQLQQQSARTNLRLRDEGAAPEKYRRAVEEYYRRLSGARPRQ
jgi:hypothetical protein